MGYIWHAKHWKKNWTKEISTYNDFIEKLIDKDKILSKRVFIKNTKVIFDDTCSSM